MDLLSPLTRPITAVATTAMRASMPTGFRSMLAALGLEGDGATGSERQLDVAPGKGLPEPVAVDPAAMIVPPPQFMPVPVPPIAATAPAPAPPPPVGGIAAPVFTPTTVQTPTAVDSSRPSSALHAPEPASASAPAGVAVATSRPAAATTLAAPVAIFTAVNDTIAMPAASTIPTPALRPKAAAATPTPAVPGPAVASPDAPAAKGRPMPAFARPRMAVAPHIALAQTAVEQKQPAAVDRTIPAVLTPAPRTEATATTPALTPTMPEPPIAPPVAPPAKADATRAEVRQHMADKTAAPHIALAQAAAEPEQPAAPEGAIPAAAAAVTIPAPRNEAAAIAPTPAVSEPAIASPDAAAAKADAMPAIAHPRMAGEAVAPRIAIAQPAAESGLADRPVARPHSDDSPAVTIAGLSMAEPASPRPVAATTTADQGALNTHDDSWMQGMIDRIETLRDAAGGVGETRIRLSPDALGDVEISLHRTGDGVAVRFASDNPDAARLLADAQPRLAELAEARGLKLGGMQVDVGQQQQQRREPPAPAAAARSTRPAPHAAPVDPVHDDIRIA